MRNRQPQKSTQLPFVVGGFFVLVGLIAILGLLGSYYTVDEGDRGVVVRNGVVVSVSEPGLHFKVPFITKVIHVTTRNQVVAYEGLEAYTTDQQIATIEAVNISYRIPVDRVEEVYRDYQTPEAVVDRFIGRRINAELEKIFGQYTAERSVRERVQLSADIASALKKVPDYAPIEILAVEMASVAYPHEYTVKINERMNAEVEVAKKIQEVRQAEQDKLISNQQADAEAYKLKAEADAKAHSIRVQGEAEADAIRMRSQALANNPALIELTKAENWNGVLPTTVLPNGTIPFIDADK